MTDINDKSMVPENGTEAGKDRSAELARLAIAALEDKKAEDVRVIDIGDVSVLADYFIIASGNNRIQDSGPGNGRRSRGPPRPRRRDPQTD